MRIVYKGKLSVYTKTGLCVQSNQGHSKNRTISLCTVYRLLVTKSKNIINSKLKRTLNLQICVTNSIAAAKIHYKLSIFYIIIKKLSNIISTVVGHC